MRRLNRIAGRAAACSALSSVLVGSTLLLAACGDTLQDQPIAAGTLEQMVLVDEYPVYWLGSSFAGMAPTNALRDPSGAFTVQYGDCTEGGQNTCVAPLVIVTSPDNRFRPTGTAPVRAVPLRHVRALLVRDARTIEIATGAVVVDIYAATPAMALQAANTMVPINRAGLPTQPLPQPLANSGFAGRPLVGQLPPPVAHLSR